jgi:hypothetical protein
MNEDIKIVRAMHGSAQADGDATIGRVSFRLSASPERRWLALFEISKPSGFSTEERGKDVLLHVECLPGEVANKRDAAVSLLADVNSTWHAEMNRQSAIARERHEKKRKLEEALNQELETLNFDRS